MQKASLDSVRISAELFKAINGLLDTMNHGQVKHIAKGLEQAAINEASKSKPEEEPSQSTLFSLGPVE